MDKKKKKSIIEGILFSVGESISPDRIGKALGIPNDEVESLLSEDIIAEKLKKGDIPTLKYVNKKFKLVKE